MAILISSKNVYKSSNNKVKDNFIDNVEVSQTIITPKNQYGASIYNSKVTPNRDVYPYQSSETNNGNEDSSITADERTFVAISTKIDNKYKIIDEIIIPKIQGNNIVTKLLTNNSDTNETYTKVTSFFEEKQYFYDVDKAVEFKIESLIPNMVYSLNFGWITIASYPLVNSKPKEEIGILTKRKATITAIQEKDSPSVFPKGKWVCKTEENKDTEDDIKLVGVFGNDNEAIVGQPFPSIEVDTTNNLAIENDYANLEIEEFNDYYKVKNIKVFNSRMIYNAMTALWFKGNLDDFNNQLFPCKVLAIEQKALETEITFYGNIVGIDLTTNSVKYIKDSNGNIVDGIGNKPLSLNNNELLQITATCKDNSLTKELASNVLNQYQKGKETATLLCDISDYYEYDITQPNNKGNKVISINNANKMCFDIGDQVIPMVFGANGKDKPMSLKQDGTPKEFRVVGTNIIYDGAVWQEITLQEL